MELSFRMTLSLRKINMNLSNVGQTRGGLVGGVIKRFILDVDNSSVTDVT